MIVLIPALDPGDTLPRLVADLLAADPDTQVLVVDDGSSIRSSPVFTAAQAAGATVIAHDVNHGKGAALKSGFAHIAQAWPGEDVVTADADGQHTVADIVRVAERLRADATADEPTLVLGCRTFSGPGVPARSRIGNTATRWLFRAAAGTPVSDTQTGLRGIPATLLDWLRGLHGERFEYELTMLLRAPRDGIALTEVPIETVYLGRNESSHFRPVIDSLRVLLPIVLFAGSSLLAFLVDTIALLVFTALTGWMVPSIVAARVLSAAVNFTVNRRVVFARGGRIGVQALRYGLLALALLGSNIAWMSFLTDSGWALLPAKIATEIVLFVISYGVQRSVVFGPQDAGTAGPHVGRRPDPALHVAVAAASRPPSGTT
ncbi:bifunctional glycosyltransferase family 2/GtrA family protein [Microbacterium terricola]|uniref:Polysaccharide synthesis protein GtrA n=1 Tax=Microbacterium terricola TaxID=344163 RepID=A0ABM8E099_9MICO|nr:bifunctional glycosyltransferase family 2/GtrA family protein [Microbacterium terricola]UYK41021.1 bifunctional glycosyltransferase family 2/GtrA family protein [Microbacterium terricola]BDV31222.1 polysaccharide synthesis protein GtrA [Microbacterium terricola]